MPLAKRKALWVTTGAWLGGSAWSRGLFCVLTLLASACGRAGDTRSGDDLAMRWAPPPPPPPALAPLVGEYASDGDTVSVLEDEQELYLRFWKGPTTALRVLSSTTFTLGEGGDTVSARWEAEMGHEPGSTGSFVALDLAGRAFPRLSLGGEAGSTFRIVPIREPGELADEALAAAPPEEEGEFLPSDLVELVALDSTILLDVRYASTNNFMGEVFYSSPRVFLQRPAAEAVVRAHRWLKERGYGLLIHDGYRPWYVTKMFWDATPEHMKNFVADPANGSRHNRGCAVDLTLYDLTTGEVVSMPAGFDEFSPRSHSDYPGGTSRQRWFRALLREAMEAQEFSNYPDEWWHFDYKDWRRYRLGNEVFEEIG